jgi:hypothetical protein
MSGVLQFASALSQAGQLRQARVLDALEGADVTVQVSGTTQLVRCQVLHTGAPGLTLSQGDAVLVWLQDEPWSSGVVLGRMGPYTEPSQPVVAPENFVGRPQTLVLEAQGDIVLRNGHAKLTLGAEGDVEVVCTSYTARSQRLLRLLAPLIKLN